MRIEEATGESEFLQGQCLKCGWSRQYKAWVDPYEGLNHGDLMHDIIFGFTRPGEIRD